MMTVHTIWAYYKNCFMLSQNFKRMAGLMKTAGHADLLQGKNQEHVGKIIPESVFVS